MRQREKERIKEKSCTSTGKSSSLKRGKWDKERKRELQGNETKREREN